MTYPLKWLTAGLALGYAPRSPEDLDQIREQGVTAILNLCAECYDLDQIQRQAG